MNHRVVDGVRRYFFRGLLAVLPLAITFWILNGVIALMERVLLFLPRWLRPEHYLPVYYPVIGALFSVVLICVVGYIVTNVISHRLHDLWDRATQSVPVFSSVYRAVRRLAQAVLSGEAQSFRRVVLIEYPRKGLFTLGLVTGVAEGEVQEKARGRVLNVFIPTTPNPTSGWYILVPEDEAVPLAMSVEDAFKLVISGGIVVPEQPGADADRDGLGAAQPARR